MWHEEYANYWCTKLNFVNLIPQVEMNQPRQIEFSQYSWEIEGRPDEATLNIYRQYVDFLYQPNKWALTRYQKELAASLFTLSPNVALIRPTNVFLPHTVWFPNNISSEWAGIAMPEPVSQVAPSQFIKPYPEYHLVHFTLPDESLSGWIFPIRTRGEKTSLHNFYPEVYREYATQDDPKDLACIVKHNNTVYFSIWKLWFWFLNWQIHNDDLNQPENIYTSLANQIGHQLNINPANLFERRAFGYDHSN